MNHPAKYTNGDWTLPLHARGVLRTPDPIREQRIPAGEPGHVAVRNASIVLADPSEPEKGWALK